MISDMASKDNATQPTAELFSTAAVRAEQGWKKFPMRRVGAIGPIPGRAQTSASTAVPAAVLLNEQSQQQGKGLSDVTSGAGSAMGALPSLLGSLSGQNTVLTGNKSEEQLLQEQVFAARMMGAPATVASGIAATFRSNNVVSSSMNALPNWNTQPSMTSQKTLPPAQQAQAHLIATAFFNTIKPKLSQGNETPQAAPQSQQPQDLYQLQQELQAQLNNRQQKQQQYLLRPQQHEVPMRVPQQFSGSTAALNVSSKAQPQKWSNRTQSLTSNKQSDISSGELLGKLPGMLSALESNAGPQIPAIAHQREIPSDQSSNLQRQPAANLTSKYFKLRGPLQKNGPAVGSLPASNLPLSMSSLATSTGSITQPQKQGLQLLEKARKPLPVELQMTQSMEVLQSLKADGYIDSPKRKKMAKGSGFEATTDIVDNNSTIWPSTLEGDWNHPKPVPEPPNYKNLKGEKTPVGRSKSKKADKVHGKKTSTPPQSSRSQNFLKGVDKATDGAPKSPWHASVDAFLQSTKRATGSDLKTSSKDRSEVQSPEVTTPVPTISPSLFSTAVATEIPFLTEVDTDETISSINRRVEMLKQQKAKILQDQMEEFYKEINITDDGAGKDGPTVTHKKTINQKVAGSRDKDKDKPRLNEHDKSRLDDRRDKDRDRHINRDKEKDKRRDDDRDRRTGTRSPPRKRPSDSKRSRSESRHQEPERKQQDHKPALSPQRSRNSSLERTKKDGASSKESSKEIEKRQGRYPSGNLHVPSADSAERRASLSPERKRKRLDEKMGEVFIDGRWQQSTLKTPPASTRGEDQPNGDKSKTKDSKVDKIKAKMGKDQDNKKREDMATPSKKTEKEEKTTPTKKTEEKNKGKNTDTATTGKGASTSKAPGNKSPVKSDSQTNTAEKTDEKSAPTKPPEAMKEKNDTLITAEGRKEQQDDGLSKTEGEKEKEMTESREKKMAGKVQIKSISKATELSESPAASKSTKVSESSDKGSSSAAQTSTSRVVPSINKSLPPASVNTSESSQVSGTSPSGSTGTSTAKQSTLPSEVEEINVKRSTGVSAGNGPSTVSASATATSGPAVGQNSRKRKGDKVPLTEDVPKKVSVISQDPPSTLEIKDSSIPHQMGLLEALAIEEYVQDKVMVEWFCYVCGSICHSWKVYMGHIGGRKHTTKYQRLLHADCPTLERELISKLKLLPKKGADPIAEATMGSSILGQSFALASKKNMTASPLAGSGQGSFLRSEEHKKSEGIRPRCVACNLVFQKVAEYRKHLRTPAHKKKIAAQEKPAAPPVKSLQAPNEANQPLTDDSVRSTNSEGTKSPQPKSSVIGSEFITPISGFFCKLCSKFYNNEKTAREVHCATTLHIAKTQQYYASRNQSMDTSFKASQGTVPSDTSVTAPAPAGNVLSNRFETAQADAGVKTSVSDYVDGGHPSCTSRPNFDQKASSVGQVFPVGGSFKPDHPDTPVMPSSDPQYVPGRAMSKTLAVAESHMESVTTEVKEEGVKPGGAMLIETTMSKRS
ncbi:uncharacterized protein LOC110988569 [Acanthaster planci]|uniref:Uncharacterized protein LOC110988569 n=1 Tax=Acanthaster planci TaxID=133434 RepID=A0A8B7ZQR9_ACAPL|nr:uncharacterized protein LOC110988569 [Acanthaster planci]